MSKGNFDMRCSHPPFLSASFGGIVGLCMGFSILSGFELIYFFTLRTWIDHRREKGRKKKKTNGRFQI